MKGKFIVLQNNFIWSPTFFLVYKIKILKRFDNMHKRHETLICQLIWPLVSIPVANIWHLKEDTFVKRAPMFYN